jgi:drug/metabolite transporter (DMT)-like permease
MALTLVGATVVVTSGVTGTSGATPSGDGLVLAGVVCGAAYALVVARTVRQGHPLTLALVQQVWALALVLPAATVTAIVGGAGPLPHGVDVLLVALSGLLSYLVPFALYLAALQKMPAAEATQYLALIPVAGLVGAAVLLGEPLTARALVGGAVMMVALGGLARTRAGHRPAAPSC